MITKKEPKNDSREAVKLSKIFSNRDNTCYKIESDLQRKFCWTDSIIDNMFKQYIIDLFDENNEADKNFEDCSYGTLGDGILTEKKDNQQEIIDMSQRITTSLAITAVMIYIHLRNANVIDISEREDYFNKYLKTKNKQSWKIMSTFRDSDFGEVLNSLIYDTFKVDKKSLKSATKCFSGCKKNEVKYKSFKSLCSYIYTLIDDTIGFDDEFIIERLNCFLENTYVQIEICEKEERVKKFIEVNTNREGIAPKDVYKSLISTKSDKINEKFQEFEAQVESITSSDKKRINILKSPITPTEYIMKLALINLDETRETCKNTFSLSDERFGIEHQLKDGILDNEEKILHFLDICIDICNFLKDSMVFKPEGFNEEWYLLTENHIKKYIWLYNILPCYAISKLKDNEKKTYAFNMLFKSYMAYSIKYSETTSVQYIQPYMYQLSKEILEKADEDFDIFKTSIDVVYNGTFGEFINKKLTKAVKSLCYSSSKSKSGIYAILSMFEYESQKLCGLKRDNLHRIINTTKKYRDIEIDHILPQNKETQENEEYIDKIGNLVLLEKPLNASKQDTDESNSKIYSNSGFITTKLLIEGNVYETLTKKDIEDIYNNVIPYKTTEDTINNFESEIMQRTNCIALKVKDYLTVK